MPSSMWQEQGRSSLGKFIERSTSAPPTSSGEALGDVLVGDELLDHMTRGYGGFSNDSPSSTFNKDDANQILLSEPRFLERPVSAAAAASHAGVPPGNIWSQRSKSATPSVGPPPGLGPMGFLQRSTSAPQGGGALRPNAKTLMDLIQEDYPPEDQQQQPVSERRSTSPGYTSNGYGGGGSWQQQREASDLHSPYALPAQAPLPTHLPQQQPHVVLRNMMPPQQQQQPPYQQQIYYQHATSAMDARQLQAQVLPNGQTVYVNAAPAPQYSYAPVPYQQQDNRLVSVVPVGQQQPPYYNEGGGNSYDHGGHPYGGRNKGSRGRRSNPRGAPKHGGSSCALLDDFRQSKNRDWTVFRIQGNVVDFCQDQNGSRFIQQRLEMADPVEQDVVMREILPSIRSLRNDVFGNYVVQKLLDFGTSQMKEDLWKTMKGEMLQMSLQMYGCRVVQKALETLPDEDLAQLLQEFHHNVLSCIHDQNGNHVIQKCIEVMNARAKKAGDADRARYRRDQIEFILQDVLHNALSLSCHPYGCRVLQRIFEHCEESKKTLILDQVLKSHRQLLDDQYGNYVIQHVLQFGREKDRDSILAIVADLGLLGLSRQKFASNVVEKLLKHGNDKQRKAIVREMLKPAKDPTGPRMNGDSTVVLFMVRDAYANYVVQTTLDVVPDSEERRLLLEELNTHSEELRNYTFAKHIVTKLAVMNQASS